MKFGFQIDPVHTLNYDTDSTLPMILESQRRKNRNYVFSPSSLTFKKRSLYAQVKEIKFKNNKLNSYTLSSEKKLNLDSLNNIVNLFNSSDMKIVFPAGYKTQEMLKSYDLKLNSNILMVDPLGYLEFMFLLKKSTFVMSDSGTVVEGACIMNIPSIQMRYSTERPEVYDVGASIKFDPSSKISDFQSYIDKVVKLVDTKWEQPFGDGEASNNIVDDLVELSHSNSFHKTWGLRFIKYHCRLFCFFSVMRLFW